MAQPLPQSPDQLRMANMDLVLNSLYLLQGINPVAGNSPIAVPSCSGLPVLATAGNDTACTNGTIYFVEYNAPVNKLATNINFLIGSVGGTDKVIASIHDANGNLLANSATAGATVGTAANFQAVALTATYQLYANTRYLIGLTFNGTTAKFRTLTIPGTPFVAGSATQTFGTPATFTGVTTFTANVGPFVAVT